jgi:hypothetical protein
MLFSFSHTMVVTYAAKACAAIALVLVNGFFVFFTILRSADKGYLWQWSFVMACLFQLLIDVFLYETLQCCWVGDTSLDGCF